MTANQWSNKLGWDVRIGRRYFEVFPNGAVRRDIKDDLAPGGFTGIEYTPPFGACPDTAAGAVKLVRAMIHAKVWKPCT